MGQQRLPLKQKPTLPAQRKAMEDANLGTARIILERPEMYAGLQVDWAREIVRKHSVGRLF
jgi:hypothetical protein